MKLELNEHSTPFNLESTLTCGQLFRWEKVGSWWLGIAQHQAFKVRQTDNILEFEGTNTDFIKNYFRLDDDLQRIVSEINRDTWTKQAVQTFYGLRLARQDPWECLVSYMCATFKNILAIKGIILNLARRFGSEFAFEGQSFYTFPKPKALAKATLSELRMCKLGFRARRVRETARIVDCNKIGLEDLKAVDYETAKHRLLQLPGVGNKVADCILLFSLEKLEAFPVDIWMKKVIQRYYSNHFDELFIHKILDKKTLSAKEYSAISAFARNYFGRYAGYAQEYLYHFVRAQNSKDLRQEQSPDQPLP
ncbi:MAG: hypothetical protein JSV51_09950 [Candidatus Bathyarchaeota archaeon]|nr:MAG: hypothetical protein JSV51_09950 [Candidatus Bathyarchaeota archaeon]